MSAEPCRHFNTAAGCRHGENCRYAHINVPQQQQQQQQQPPHAHAHAHAHAHHHQQQRRECPTNAAREAIATTIEVLAPGVQAIVDVDKVSEAILAPLLTLPPPKSNAEASGKLLLALDYHGVTDLVPPDQPLLPEAAGSGTGSVPIVVVSYVGAFGEIRNNTRADIIRRIEAGQVRSGVLVFKKLQVEAAASGAAAASRNDDESQLPPDYFTASKRHAVELLLKYNTAGAGMSNNRTAIDRCVFVDDSKDNVNTVESLGHARVESCHFRARSGAELSSFLMEKVAANASATE